MRATLRAYLLDCLCFSALLEHPPDVPMTESKSEDAGRRAAEALPRAATNRAPISFVA